jgi:membrane fusion protein, copper/silver efflux system
MRPGAPEVLKKMAQATVNASREKLRRWGMTDGQIAQAEKSGISSDHVTIYAPIAGTVVERKGQEGMYVATGTAIYTIADLTSLWVQLDAYESDLAWLRYGQRVTFTAEAYPGETFEGTISFIDPVLDKMTRTAKVRVVVANDAGRLKPEMFVRAVVQAGVTEGGGVRGPSLAGKWISPMHPEIIKDQPGTCDVCGMALVAAEELGLAADTTEAAGLPLVIPASAPLLTGARAVVYVEIADAEDPTFEGREVVLGPRAGDFYTIREGLVEGERVVTNGSFKIDSALQIQAKSSMMNPEGGEAAKVHDHGEYGSATKEVPEAATRLEEVPAAFQKQFRSLSDAYLRLSEALASDDYPAARAAAEATDTALDDIDMALLKGDAHMRWMGQSESMKKALSDMTDAQDIGSFRVPLLPLTKSVRAAIETFGIGAGAAVYQAHCPMAFDGKGGNWLQAGNEVRNPYYGDMMLNCGTLVGRVDEAQDE